MYNVSYIGTEDSLTVIVNNNGNVKTYNVDSSNPNWGTILEKLDSAEYDGFEELLSVKKNIETIFRGANGVEVNDLGVKYNGEYVNNYLTNKIFDFQKRKLPYKPLVNFFEKVMKNPSRRAVNELYKFLEHGQMPITPEGNFLGYKSVTRDYKDWHTRKFDNSVGQTLAMERNQVCDNANEGCSYGFHVGTLGYANTFHSGASRVVIVEVDPSDVVSVPHDCEHQKLRTAKYTVVGEFEKPLDNDFSDDYTDEEEVRTAEDIENEMEEIRDVIASECLSIDDLQCYVNDLKALEEELEELQEDDSI
jgi:hypothetical protein